MTNKNNVVLNLTSPRSCGRQNMRGIGAARSSTARSVIPQACNAGYSGRSGFTLIELLVVVLIIGILAAIALPQYQKAVEKSKAVQAFALLNSLGEAGELYYLTHGTYPTRFDELDVDMSAWTGRESWAQDSNYYTQDIRSNKDWSLILMNSKSGYKSIQLGRLTGPYQGAGWIYRLEEGHRVFCIERTAGKITFQKSNGAYCTKIWNKSSPSQIGGLRIFQ